MSAGGDAIAIVGIGVVCPGASSVDEFWRGVESGASSIREAPSDLADVQAVFDPGEARDDSSYTTLGAFVTSGEPVRRARRLVPELADVMDRAQAFAIAAADEAIRDAGLGGRDLGDAAVVLGNALGGTRQAHNA